MRGDRGRRIIHSGETVRTRGVAFASDAYIITAPVGVRGRDAGGGGGVRSISTLLRLRGFFSLHVAY